MFTEEELASCEVDLSELVITGELGKGAQGTHALWHRWDWDWDWDCSRCLSRCGAEGEATSTRGGGEETSPWVCHH